MHIWCNATTSLGSWWDADLLLIHRGWVADQGCLADAWSLGWGLALMHLHNWWQQMQFLIVFAHASTRTCHWLLTQQCWHSDASNHAKMRSVQCNCDSHVHATLCVHVHCVVCVCWCVFESGGGHVVCLCLVVWLWWFLRRVCVLLCVFLYGTCDTHCFRQFYIQQLSRYYNLNLKLKARHNGKMMH